MVRGQELSTGMHLVGTPADYVDVSALGRLPAIGKALRTEIAVSGEFVAKQSRVDPSMDFAPAPDGYALLHAAVKTELGVDRPVRVSLVGRNLLNTRYREYTSLRRYYADQPGRDVQLRVGTDF